MCIMYHIYFLIVLFMYYYDRYKLPYFILLLFLFIYYIHFYFISHFVITYLFIDKPLCKGYIRFRYVSNFMCMLFMLFVLLAILAAATYSLVTSVIVRDHGYHRWVYVNSYAGNQAHQVTGYHRGNRGMEQTQSKTNGLLEEQLPNCYFYLSFCEIILIYLDIII